MVSWVTSTPSGSNDRMISLASWATTGSVALSARWSGDPGRSPLLGLAVAGEAVTDGPPPVAVVYLGPGTDPDIPLSADPRVLEALTGGLGAGGVGVVAHDAKEIMRSLLPLGVDVTP